MKCIDCIRILPPHRGRNGETMPGQGKCPDDPIGTTRSLRYDRQCAKFKHMTEVQRDAKREEWKKILNSPKRAQKETEDESGS